MKNVTCRQLIIDRQKAPKNVGTLKDISLYGSYSFPTSGEYKGGLIGRSMAGIGSKMQKTRAQVEKIACRTTPVAGETAAKISEEMSISNHDTQVLTPSEL